MAIERIGNTGYIAFATEATAGTAVTPTMFAQIFDETISTNYNLEDQDPIFGNPAQTFQVLGGLRDHKGDFTMVAEPNTVLQAFDMLLTRGTVTGANPYTWPFTLSATTLPKSKTIDISTTNVVKRFTGVQASKIALSESKNQLMLKVSVSALSSFQGGLITSITGAGPYTVVFDTTYDANPASQLVVGDLIRFYHQATGVTTDATVATVSLPATFTCATNPTPSVAGDMVYLRPQNPSFTLQPPFLWSNTQFCFGTTAANALSATQTRLEQGSSWEVDYGFESDSGSQRSGDPDPASLVRMLGKPSLNIKKFFDTPDDVMLFNNITKNACVVRHYSSGTTYEMRVTMNGLRTNDPLPKIKSKAVNYSDIKYSTQYDTTDSQMFDVKVIASINSIA